MKTSKTSHRNDSRKFWPAQVTPELEPLLQIFSELDITQWWPEERLFEMQRMQLSALLNHARANTDYYSGALRGFDAFTPESITRDLLSELPVTDKQTVQIEGARLVSREHDPRFGKLSEFTTSGSVSKPVTITWNQYALDFVSAKTFRYHQWHGSNPTKKMLALRVRKAGIQATPGGIRSRDWYPLMPGGEHVRQDAGLPTATQMEWLKKDDPSYLFTYPSNASALLHYARENGISLPSLERIDVFGETMSDDLPSLARDVFDCAIGDKYGSQEIGEMATRCPVSGLYHIQSETVYLEVRKDDGTLAREGEIGQIIVTNLHNTAMPLIRYAIEDYAEVGPECPCGRGLPTIRRVVGRSRNMLRLEDGTHIWLVYSLEYLCDAAPVRQSQLVQTSINEFKLLVVPLRELSDAHKDALCEKLWTTFPRTVRFTVECVPEIPRSESGKFEFFRSEIGAHDGT